MENKDHIFINLINKISIKFKESNKERLLIAISGIPGSGKSTFSKEFCNFIKNSNNENNNNNININSFNPIVIPFDGFHIYKNNLNEDQIKYRGRIDTFNLKAFEEKLSKLKFSKSKSNLNLNSEFYFPSFDHKIKDPIEDDIKISANNNLIIFEGLYLLINNLFYEKYFDLCIFLESDINNSMERVAQRNFEAGISDTIEDSRKRADFSDKINAQFVIDNSISISENLIKIKYLD
jgi:pantothenate kinase